MPPQLATPHGSSATKFTDPGLASDGVDLEDVLALTHRLSEEVLCAKLSGNKPQERHITKLVIIATELKKVGINYPPSLRYALDIPRETSEADIIRLKQYGRLKGFVEEATSQYVRGWALNEEMPRRFVELEILVNKVLVAIVNANAFREDLANAGIGAGYHAFHYRFVSPISLIQDKKIVVRRRADRAILQVIAL